MSLLAAAPYREVFLFSGIYPENDDFLRVHSCLAKFVNYSRAETEAPPGVPVCPVIFDSWNCWPATLAGKTAVMPCPNFPDFGFSASRE